MTDNPRRTEPASTMGLTAASAWTLAVLTRVADAWTCRLGDRRSERGDVPGWVLVTLMTAGLVTMLWALAGAQLSAVFTNAISSVTGAK